jgi:hypothetical protein
VLYFAAPTDRNDDLTCGWWITLQAALGSRLLEDREPEEALRVYTHAFYER